MKKILLFASIGLMLVACESREEKIQNAVSQELKGVLYDFESYEPIKNTNRLSVSVSVYKSGSKRPRN